MLEVKFVYIAVCLIIALGSYFACWSRRDWVWLVLALGFTLAADYFLILRDLHLIGVAVFCFVHLAYICRAWGQGHSCGARHLGVFFAPVGLFLVVAGVALIWVYPVFVVTALYALLFIYNIYVSARHVQHNRRLILVGLLLFAACDVCVLLFNLPRYFNAPAWLRDINPLIWVFYLPSQLLLAVSAVAWRSRSLS